MDFHPKNIIRRLKPIRLLRDVSARLKPRPFKADPVGSSAFKCDCPAVSPLVS
jgi:hypothetical protein